MSTTLAELPNILDALEGENLEFKEAKISFSSDLLGKYCAALANEGGGKVVLEVTDKRPRKVVGTQAFPQLERTRAGLMDKIPLRIDCSELHHPDGRVLVFEIPSRPIGVPIKYEGIYWSRKADGLVPISEDKLRIIFEESGRDFSAEICPGVSPQDLDPTAIEDFRRHWIEKSKSSGLAALSPEQLLRDTEVLTDGGVTYAALILFGNHSALGKYLGQAEVVFEYRSNEAPGPAQQRKEYRQGFFSFYDDLWNTINLRNDLQHYQDGLFMRDIPTFEEKPVRETILNAVSHRDYRSGGSVFIRQYPRRLEIVSPGGFPAGITPENIIWNQNPRNRRIAEVLAKCGLVERAGQGFDLIYRECIRQSKPLPDFSRTDNYFVWLTLHGEIQDPEFLRFLEQVGQEKMASFNTEDFLAIDRIHREQPVPDNLKTRIPYLLDQGVIERLGRGRGVRHLLSRRFYRFLGKPGVYTRKRGLDRDQNKALLVKHIQDNQDTGSKMEVLKQVLPGHSRSEIQVFLRELIKEEKIHVHGKTRAARWYPGAKQPDCNHDRD
ncbi:MAG: putative DNA binding domain-containing protein [Proteobacteria bacterium]|nr:putative DNA binding domain-containing protein [Pseudomonadota bacterium]